MPTWRVMSADTMKMPEPIIEPATSVVESNSERPGLNFCEAGAVVDAALVIATMVASAAPESAPGAHLI